jgi:hypothetical protein
MVATSETGFLFEIVRIGRAMLASSIIAAGLGGCASEAHRPEPRAQQYPENYKTELLDYFHGSLNDPTKIREAAIADPALKSISEIRDSGSADSSGGGRGGRRRGGRSGGSDSSASEGNVNRERYVVCVRYNAKDRDGHYTGVKQGMAVYAGGRFDGFTEQPKGACDQAEFKPFPELEKLSR